LKINARESKYMLISCHQNYNINTDNKPFESVIRLKYLEMTAAAQSYIHTEVKSKLNLGYACWHSIKNISSSHLLSKDLEIKTYK
jgi:hypothetical protein